jgi:transcription termination factor Rho
MVLAELRQLAAELKISDTTGMRKGDLIAAIKERQSAGAPAADAPQLPLPGAAPVDAAPVAPAPVHAAPADAAAADAAPADAALVVDGAAEAPAPKTTRRRRTASRPAGAPGARAAGADATAPVEATAPAAAPPAVADPVPAPAAEPVPAAVEAAPAELALPEPVLAEPATEAPAVADAPVEAPAGNGAAPAEERQEERGGRRGRNRRNRGGDQADAAQNGSDRNGAVPHGAPQSGSDRNGAGQNGAGQNGAVAAHGGAVAPAEPAPADPVDDERGRGRGRGDRGADGRDGRGDRSGGERDRNGGERNDRDRNGGERDRNDRDRGGVRGGAPNGAPDDDLDDDGDGRGRRGRRFRDRRRGRDRADRVPSAAGGGIDTDVRDDDVLLDVAGIVDILDNYAFVRTTGYLSGPTDCYVSMAQVRRYGLRRGDAITGAVREQREGEQSRQKFNPLVRVDSVNGLDPEQARHRPEFTKLTPLYPNERLRLETESHKLTTRVIDLVMPIGKGQRALIVSPPKAGKTTIMQNIANAITTNNPECHLMVVLVDERPEEVTDMQRSVKGEVIASTFDRPPTDHTTIAELSIERAKRLVELGHDVVVLLDNITRLGRAYNLAAPASGRILSGGVDSTALYPPKRFLGAARNIEDGGSLTILATALVETGSTMDTVIFEEFKGTGNAELRLDRRIADKRVFPAIDVGESGTRKEELLMSPDEYAVMVKLRRLLSALNDQQAIDLLLTQLKKTRTNIEFLMQVQKGLPVGDDD